MPAQQIGGDQLTMLDHARRVDPDGKIGVYDIVEMLNRINHPLEDAVMIEGNRDSGHQATLRTGLPAVAFRSFNIGTQSSKSTTKQVVFTAGKLEGLSKVDEDLVELGGNGAALRESEMLPFIESMSQTITSTMFYGDVRVNPDRFTGLSAYMGNLNASYQSNPDAEINPSSTAPDSGRNVFDASTNSEGEVFGNPSAGNNTSLWLIVWHRKSIATMFPKGSRAGIYHEDKGKWLVDDGRGLGAQYFAWVDQYKARFGVVASDWRQMVRIANIDVNALASAGDDNDQSANLLKNAIQAVNYVQYLNMGKARFYCNRIVKTYLEVKAANKSNAMLKYEESANAEPVTKLCGIPIRRCDALLNTEAQVS